MTRWVAALCLGLGITLAAPSAASAEDFVTGSVVLDDCPLGCFIATVDAHSGPLGQDAAGTADYALRVNAVGGPVTCLAVSGNRAVVGGQSVEFLGPGYLFLVEDNAASGTPDRFAPADLELPQPPTSCPSPEDLDVPMVPARSGDLVVHDAPAFPTSKEQCKNGGWEAYGVFKNQGDCVRSVRHHARLACIFERVAHGVRAFRDKYGIAYQGLDAMERCVQSWVRGEQPLPT